MGALPCVVQSCLFLGPDCSYILCYAHGIHLAACDALYAKNATGISATASEEMRDEDDSPYLSQDEELENEDFSTAVDLENDCC